MWFTYIVNPPKLLLTTNWKVFTSQTSIYFLGLLSCSEVTTTLRKGLLMKETPVKRGQAHVCLAILLQRAFLMTSLHADMCDYTMEIYIISRMKAWCGHDPGHVSRNQPLSWHLSSVGGISKRTLTTYGSNEDGNVGVIFKKKPTNQKPTGKICQGPKVCQGQQNRPLFFWL